MEPLQWDVLRTASALGPCSRAVAVRNYSSKFGSKVSSRLEYLIFVILEVKRVTEGDRVRFNFACGPIVRRAAGLFVPVRTSGTALSHSRPAYYCI